MATVTLDKEQLKQIQQLELAAMKEIDQICKKHQIKYSLSGGTLIGAIRHRGFIPWDDDIDVMMLREEYEKFKKVCKNELDSRFFYQDTETDPEYLYLFDKIRINDTIFGETFLANHQIHRGVYIDIFPLDNISDNSAAREKQLKMFTFYRNGFQAKYLSLKARHGKKKLMAYLANLMYLSWPTKKLQDQATKWELAYQNKTTKQVRCFPSEFFRTEVYDRADLEEVIEWDFEDTRFYVPKNYDKLLRLLYGDYMQLPPEEARKAKHDINELKLS